MAGFRPTVRFRLTLLYGGLFLLAGTVLLSVNYALVRHSLDVQRAPLGVDVVGPDASFTAPAPEPHEFITPSGERAADVIRRIEGDLRNQTLHQLVVHSSIALALMALVSIGLGSIGGRSGSAADPAGDGGGATVVGGQPARAAGPDRPPDEVKELADTFDAMLARLESAFDSQRTFVSNASHELRTPLSIQRTVLDVALADPGASTAELRAMAGSVSDAVDRSQHLIDGLLVLARSEQGVADGEIVDLAEVAAQGLEQAAAEAGEAGHLTVDRSLAPAPVNGNQVLLERLVVNLVQNAVRHNRPGGWLTVATTRHAARPSSRFATAGR